MLPIPGGGSWLCASHVCTAQNVCLQRLTPKSQRNACVTLIEHTCSGPLCVYIVMGFGHVLCWGVMWVRQGLQPDRCFWEKQKVCGLGSQTLTLRAFHVGSSVDKLSLKPRHYHTCWVVFTCRLVVLYLCWGYSCFISTQSLFHLVCYSALHLFLIRFFSTFILF